ncbi:MAG: hypothetical protein K6E91_00320 [Butyrivibrio sp.]|nr:hypothetical protein [Butyrivibrio sp.]
MSQHKDAVTNAAEAKKEYQTAKQDLDESIKKLDDVNTRIEKLEAELLTDEEINKLQN